MSDNGVRSEYVDIKTGVGRVLNNKALYRKLLNMYLESDEFEKLDAHLKAEDYTAAGDVAHTIKGMTGNLALLKLADVSTQLMKECREGEPNHETVAQYYDISKATKEYVEEVAIEIDAGTI